MKYEGEVGSFLRRTDYSLASFAAQERQPADIIAIFALSGRGKSTTITLLQQALPDFMFVSGGDFQRAANKEEITKAVQRLAADPAKGTDAACESFLHNATYEFVDLGHKGLVIEARLSHMITAHRKVYLVRLDCPLEIAAEKRA